MTDLNEQIEMAKAEVVRLERLAKSASCREVGCDWRFCGGANAGCCDTCNCSVPVHKCSKCGDYDYGDNEEADKIRAECAELATPLPEGKE